nr:MAG TPA: hypothetical protein [Bacteriophage sp.]
MFPSSGLTRVALLSGRAGFSFLLTCEIRDRCSLIV